MWYYQSQEGNAGQNKRLGKLKDLEDHSIKSLVREVIQNSLDVRLDMGKPVNVKFTLNAWDKEQLGKFSKTFGKEGMDFFKKSFEKAQEDAKIKMHDGISVLTGKAKNLFSLIIEEENCSGLDGSVNGYDGENPHPSNFNSLMRMVDDNETKKKETQNSGGTWGKGSSVFTFSSSLWLWFSYSNFKSGWLDKNSNVTHSRRFMGRCVIAPFFDLEQNRTYLGEGWFCDRGNEVYPFVNEIADAYAEKIGLEKRIGNYGTTFFVPFFNSFLDDPQSDKILEEFRTQVLQNWMIPIYLDNLIIELKLGNVAIIIDKNYLRTIPNLKYKLEILDWYYDLIPKNKNLHQETIDVQVPKLKMEFKRPSNRFALIRRVSKADLVIRLIDEDEDFLNEWDTENTVALVRNRGMVVNNYRPFETADIRFESILFGGLMGKSEMVDDAKRHLDLYLAYSENPSHNKWCSIREDYPISFLERFEGKNPRPETGIYNLFRDLSRALRKFIVKERAEQNSKDICSIFKKITKLKAKGDGKVGETLFLMRKVENVKVDELGRYLYRYRLISNNDTCTIKVGFKGKIKSLEGERDKDFDVLGINEFKVLDLLDEDYNQVESGENPGLHLMPKESKIVIIRTCPLQNNNSFKNIEPLIKATANIVTNE